MSPLLSKAMPNPPDSPEDSFGVDFEFDLGIDVGAPTPSPSPPAKVPPTSGGDAVIRRKAKRPKPPAELTAPEVPPTQRVVAPEVKKVAERPGAPAPSAPTSPSPPRQGTTIRRSPKPVEQAPPAMRPPAQSPPAQSPPAQSTPPPTADASAIAELVRANAQLERALPQERKVRPNQSGDGNFRKSAKPPALDEPLLENPFDRTRAEPASGDIDAEIEAELEAGIDDLPVILPELRESNPDLGVAGAERNPQLRGVQQERSRNVDPNLPEHRDVERRSYGRRSDSSSRNKLIIAAAVVAAAAGVIAVILGSGDKKDKPEGQSASSTNEIKPVAPSREGGEIVPPKAGETDAQIMARIADSLAKFFASDSPEELLGVVRAPERVKPLIDEYYSRVDFEMPAFVEVVSSEEIMVKLRPLWQVTVSLEGGRRVVAVEDSPEGFRVDWENYVHYNPLPWNDYTENRPKEAMDFRVYAKTDHRPGYAFPEVDKYHCVQLTAHGSGTELFGYVEKESAVGQRIREMLANEYDRDCILRIQFPEDGKGGGQQVHIRELICEGWILVE